MGMEEIVQIYLMKRRKSKKEHLKIYFNNKREMTQTVSGGKR